MAAGIDDYISGAGLEPATDPKIDRTVYRRPGFGGISTSPEMDEVIAATLRRFRTERDLSRAELATLLGSIEAVYGRYERGLTKLHATQVLHLCEVLGIFPDDLLFDAAPHLWGGTPEEAHERRRITMMIQALPPETLHTVATILDSIFALQKAQAEQPNSIT